ncbi:MULTISPECIES: hypothetical protein [unclassified Nostoc]|uniref:hypothetical protein n=1 Tax=unclassified Nostoc TaxID=2593658 RepID=UPI002AD22405|nr:hypothetical protein [Nostoc sp. DedQUE03]MDZ7973111.1 hypothetical protein [Nostoc sp. DedQUE03]MDZ8046920.1 hypothetical protein [Nostoc sp. DedQUE02]
MTTAEAIDTEAVTSLATEGAIFFEQIFDISAKGGYSNDGEDELNNHQDQYGSVRKFIR